MGAMSIAPSQGTAQIRLIAIMDHQPLDVCDRFLNGHAEPFTVRPVVTDASVQQTLQEGRTRLFDSFPMVDRQLLMMACLQGSEAFVRIVGDPKLARSGGIGRYDIEE